MVTIPLSQRTLPDKHWLVYVNDNGEKKHVDLSGCAGSFARNTGYVSEDGLRAVGWRYEQKGMLCYELFNVGHTLIKFPLTPNFVQKLLGGKNAADKLRQQYGEFEQKLNGYGLKTVAE